MILAAGSSLQVIRRREHGVAVLIEIIIRFGRSALFESIRQNHSSHFRENLLGPVQFTRDSRDVFQARSAETGRVDRICSQAGEDMVRHDDLVTPTRTLVEMPLGHAAMVVAGTERASLVMPQAIVRRLARIRERWFLRLHGRSIRYAFGIVMPRWCMYLPARSA